ncbi:hypothetical protein [Nitratifractor sp.]|uniref:hypothetical protein n=1 Tax=Nitratifractor sp. TaxID=2268144 RepID=UPI0025FC95A6|nr:hypothetical protein [Nitratifractor sp.]
MASVDHSITKHVQAYEPSFETMVPTPMVKFFRTCLIWQFIRFLIINIKMILVVKKSHG